MVDRAFYAYGGIDTTDLEQWMREVGVADRRTSTLVRLWVSGVISIGYPLAITTLLATTVIGLATQDVLEVNWHPIVILMFVLMGIACIPAVWLGSIVAKSAAAAIKGSGQKYLELGNPATWDAAPRARELRQRLGERLVSVLTGKTIDAEAFVRIKVVFDLFIIEQVNMESAESIIRDLIKSSDDRKRHRTLEVGAAEEAKAEFIASQVERREHIIDIY